MEPLSETVKVMLIDGSMHDVRIAKYLPCRKKQLILNKLTDGMNIKSGQKAEDIEIEASKGMNVLMDIADAVWLDKNVSLDDVEGESLYKIISERFNAFLGKFGFKSEVPDNPSG